MRSLSLMGKMLLYTIRQWWHPTRQRPDCFLLHQPVELILHIAKYLPLPTFLLLAQTCLPLRRILLEIAPPARYRFSYRQPPTWMWRLMSREEHLESLSLKAHDLPDHWVCDHCVALHPVCYQDTPRNPWQTSCPLGWSQNRNFFCVSFDGALRIKRNHIQAALKYVANWDNINKRRKNYVRAILAPYRAERRDWGWFRSVDYNCVKIFACYKVVAVPEPSSELLGAPSLQQQQQQEWESRALSKRRYRLLMMTVWQCNPGVGVETDNMGSYVGPCPHCTYNPSWPAHVRDERLLYNMVTETYDALRFGGGDGDGGRGEGGQRVATSNGACDVCWSDFQVQFTGDFGRWGVWTEGARVTATVCSWHDLGALSPVVDPAWVTLGRSRWTPSYREPGNVRRMWEENEAFPIHDKW